MILSLILACHLEANKQLPESNISSPNDTSTEVSPQDSSVDTFLPNDTASTDTAVDSGETSDTGEDNPSLDPCEQIILLEAYGAANRLWTYDIETTNNAPVLTPNCSGMTALSANNKGQLFGLSHLEKTLYQIDTSTGDCLPQEMEAPPEYNDIQIRGLAFVEINEKEELYISALESPESLQAMLFVKQDNTLNLISPLNGMVDEKAFIDLAGTNTGRLFGLHPSNGGSVIKEWNPTTGVQLSNIPTMAPAPEGWSFVWYEETFTLFISTQGNLTSVYSFDPNTGALTPTPELPFQVVGAALSACAPDSSGS